ncbi:uncharacterized protein F5147DRAFT_778062 [Suillus discolor]|uniref:Uncharacterized protein n=1 Tax=Suillus discolor TaxID=1912936 RepID=A0A9P7EZR1_9AGAM|nr:uncharacterized protein F5147DRAFT_778062 [Suillus discolor]KAG2097259.1 hypothetical protein F5147DRAFT_778062 [Suillus discolor]
MSAKPLNSFQPGSKNRQGHFYGLNPSWYSQPITPPGQLERASSKGSFPDASTFKRCSTSSASLLRSSPSGTSESVSSLELKLHLLLKSKPLKPPVFDSKDGVQISASTLSPPFRRVARGPEHEVFSDVSESDYHYILDAIESDDNLIRKPSYIPCLQQLLVNLPTPIHESISVPLCTTMGNIISSLPLPSGLSTALRIHINTMVEKGKDNEDDEDKRNLGIPDMLIQRETRDAEFHPLWLFKVSFSQTSEAVEAKMQLAANKNPHIEGAMHFHITEAEPSILPSDEWALEQELDRKKVVRIREVGGSASGSGIVSFSHTWLHPLKVTVTTWLRPPNRQLKITNHGAQYYATAVLFPQQDAAGLENVQRLLKRTLGRIRDSTVQHLEGEHPPGSNDPLTALIKPLKKWAVPNTVINWGTCMDGFETAAKQMGFRRYRKWHENLLKCTVDEVNDAEYVPPASSKRRRRH